jgi:hypothetical protein
MFRADSLARNTIETILATDETIFSPDQLERAYATSGRPYHFLGKSCADRKRELRALGNERQIRINARRFTYASKALIWP